MAKFNYKFASIQKIKETFEKKAQKELSVIDLAINKKRAQIEELQHEAESHRNESRKKNIKISEINFHQGYQKQIQLKIQVIEMDIEKLFEERKLKLDELILKSKEHKVFNKLEEKHREKFFSEQNKIEMLDIDEIAVQKFNRKDL